MTQTITRSTKDRHVTWVKPEKKPFLIPPKNVTLGVALVLVGLLFLVSNFVPELNITTFWPAILIVLGLVALFSHVSEGK